jgi:hypothetical protein
MTQAELFLMDQVPLKTRALIPSTLKTAYTAAAGFIADTPMLSILSAQDNHGNYFLGCRFWLSKAHRKRPMGVRLSLATLCQTDRALSGD